MKVQKINLKTMMIVVVKFLSVTVNKNKITFELLRAYADRKKYFACFKNKEAKSNLKRNAIQKIDKFTYDIVKQLKEAKDKRCFSSLLTATILKDANLTHEDVKSQKSYETMYCPARNFTALATNMLHYAEETFRQKHEAIKVMRKVKATKKSVATKKKSVATKK